MVGKDLDFKINFFEGLLDHAVEHKGLGKKVDRKLIPAGLLDNHEKTAILLKYSGGFNVATIDSFKEITPDFQPTYSFTRLVSEAQARKAYNNLN